MPVDDVHTLAGRYVEHCDGSVDGTAGNVLAIGALCEEDKSASPHERTESAQHEPSTYIGDAEQELGGRRRLKALDLGAGGGAPNIDVASLAARSNMAAFGIIAGSHR